MTIEIVTLFIEQFNPMTDIRSKNLINNLNSCRIRIFTYLIKSRDRDNTTRIHEVFNIEHFILQYGRTNKLGMKL
jgi:hypothetical protein